MNGTVALGLRMLALAILVISFLGTTVPSSSAQLNSPTIRNIILFYDDYPTRNDPHYQVTREIARPLIAHLDTNGKPIDWTFDSFIFYSYWLYFQSNPTQTYINSWIDHLFAGNQVANLDATVAETKIALGQPSYRMNVFLSVPVAINATDTAAVLRNVDEMLARWSILQPTHLNLVGFYWGFTEDLSYGGIDGVIKDVASYLHSKGLKIIMIPYRGAAGTNRLHDLGVDYVTIQPNFAWSSSNDLSRFDDAAYQVSSGYADGVEFELSFWVKSYNGNWTSNLNTYLEQGYTRGWNRNAINTYYHGSDISSMGRASESDYRSAYEAIYGFIHGATQPPNSPAQYLVTVSTRKTDSSAVSGVQVTLGNQNKMTDTSGKAEFTVTAGAYSLGTQASVNGGSGIQHVLAAWADGDTENPRSITVNQSIAYDAVYKTRHQITMQVNPSGSATTSPTVGTYWYDSGQSISVQASPASGYTFRSWVGSGSGSYSGTANPASITMNGPVNETASFTVNPAVTAGSIVSVSDSPDPVARRRTVDFAVRIKNTGNVVWSSASITIKIYRPDGTWVATSVLTVGNIQPGVEYTYTIHWSVPSSAPKGIWHYGVYLNYAGILIDSSTGQGNTITVR